MATFGGYETVRELQHRGLNTVWTARAATGGPEAFLLTHFSPDALFLSAAQAESAEARFLDAVAVQAAAAEAGGEHWAKVLQTGRDDQGAWFVTEYLPGDLSKVIHGRVKFTAPALHAVATAIVAALQELRAACGRPHGNLTPDNVLLSASREVSQARIVLTDPAPGEGLSDTDDAADLRALGELLYQLVMHHPASLTGGMSVPDSPEWSRLGREGLAWRDLTSRLLSAGRGAATMALDDVVADLASLAERRRRVAPMRMIIAAVALVVLVATLWLIFAGGGGVDDNGPSVDLPVAEYVEMSVWYSWWFWPLDHGKDRTAKCDQWDEYPSLMDVRKQIDDARSREVPLDRKAEADRHGVAFNVLANPDLLATIHEAESAQLPLEEAIIKAGHEGVVRDVRKVRELLVGSAEESQRTIDAHGDMSTVHGLLNESLLAPLDAAIADYEARRWRKPRSHLVALTGDFRDLLAGRSSRTTKGLIDQIDGLLNALVLVAEIKASHETLQQLQAEIRTIAPSEPTLSQFDRCVQEDLVTTAGAGSVNDLEALKTRMVGLRDVANQVRTVAQHWRTGVDHALFAQSYTPQSPVTLAAYAEWMEEVRDPGYQTLTEPDPRADPWPESVTNRLGGLDSQIECLKQMRDLEHAEAAIELRDEIIAANHQLATLPWNRRTKGDIEGRKAEMDRTLVSLAASVDQWVQDNTIDVAKHPLSRWDWERDVSQLDELIKQLAEQQLAGDYGARLAALKDSLDGLMPDRTPWILADKESIESRIAESRETLNALSSEVYDDVARIDPRLPLKTAHAAAAASLAELKRLAPDNATLTQIQQELDAVAADLGALLELNWSTQKPQIDAGILRVRTNTDAIVARINLESGEPDEADPRLTRAWETDVRYIRNGLTQLQDGYQDEVNARRFGGRLDRIVADIEQTDDPWTRATQSQITGRLASAQTDLTTLRADLDQRMAQHGQELRTSLATGATFKTPAIAQAWSAYLQQLSTAGPTAMRQATGELKSKLEQLDALPQVIDLAPRASRGPVDNAVATRRGAAITRALAAITLEDAVARIDVTEWDAARNEYEAWFTEATALVEGFQTIESRLLNVYGLNDPHPDGLTVAELYQRRVDAQGQWIDPVVGEAFEAALSPIRSQIITIEQIAADLVDRGNLVRKAGSDENPAIAVAAWRRLGEIQMAPWPTGVEELKQEDGFQVRLKSLIETQVTDPIRRQALVDQFAGGRSRRWRACFDGLSSHNDIRSAVDLAPRFDVDLTVEQPESDFAKLAPGAKFNYLLYVFRGQDFSRLEDPDAQQQIADFLATVQQYCPQAADLPKATEFRARLAEIQPAAGAGDVSQQLGDQWQGTPFTKNGRPAVRFLQNTPQQPKSLEFVEVRVPGASKPTFLCTIEAPLWLIINLAGQPSVDPDAWKMITAANPLDAGTKEWDVVAAWEQTSTRLRARRGEWWVPEAHPDWGFAFETNPKYAPGIGEVPRPGVQHPMQWVSPQLAMHIARKLNCRLPTSAEWQAAYEVDREWIAGQLAPGATTPVRVNLRDQTWAAQDQHVAALIGERPTLAATRAWPGRGLVGSSGSDSATVLPANDGNLWFAEVASAGGGVFNDLVGNVAEYVFDLEVDIEEVPAADLPDLITQNISQWGVVGGSALSSPTVWNGSDRPFGQKAAVRAATDSFADVGFRLAFTAPSESVGQMIQKVLDTYGFYEQPQP